VFEPDLGVGVLLGRSAGAGIGGDDGTEMGRQPQGCLLVAGGAVPGEVVSGDQGGEVSEEGVQVRGQCVPKRSAWSEK